MANEELFTRRFSGPFALFGEVNDSTEPVDDYFFSGGSTNGPNDSTQAPNSTSARLPSEVNYFMAALYWVMFVVGVSGNLLLIGICVFHRSSGKQTVTQMFICSLAISDLGMMLTATWLHAYLSANPIYTFGRFFCKLSNFWCPITAQTSVSTLAVISVDRFLGIDRPGPSIFSVRSASFVIVFVWAAVAAVSAPMLFWFDAVDVQGRYPMCTVAVSGDAFAAVTLYSLLSRIIVFFLPLAITFCCYFGIWYKMAFSKIKMVGVANHSTAASTGAAASQPSSSSSSSSSRKVARMCFAIVAVFTLTWSPYQANILYYAFGSDKVTSQMLNKNLFALASANSCLNPIVYGFMWKPMRLVITKIFFRCCGVFAPNRVHFLMNSEKTAEKTTKATTIIM